jgi:hypothetical protein
MAIKGERKIGGARKKRLLKRATERLYVAVIVTPSTLRVDVMRSMRDNDSWASYIGTDKDAVIKAALKASASFGAGRYGVLVGTIDQAVKEPVRYELVRA